MKILATICDYTPNHDAHLVEIDFEQRKVTPIQFKEPGLRDAWGMTGMWREGDSIWVATQGGPDKSGTHIAKFNLDYEVEELKYVPEIEQAHALCRHNGVTYVASTFNGCIWAINSSGTEVFHETNPERKDIIHLNRRAIFQTGHAGGLKVSALWRIDQ